METNTKVLTTCNGKGMSNGLCDTCFQPLQTTSIYCGRLIEVVAPSEEVKQERKKIELGEIFEVDGYCYMFRNPTTASEKPNTDHGHILHEINFLE